MLKKKVCMLGAFAVGKTSLVDRFAYDLFSDKYHTTVGVRIEKKTVELNGSAIDLILWDLHGEDGFQQLRTSYLRGAHGCVYVVDGTRQETLDVAMDLKRRVDAEFPGLPAVMMLNKSDERQLWELPTTARGRLASTSDGPVVEVSAKSGEGVDGAFAALCSQMVINT